MLRFVKSKILILYLFRQVIIKKFMGMDLKRHGKHVWNCLLCSVFLMCSAFCCQGENWVDEDLIIENNTSECIYVSPPEYVWGLLYPEYVLSDGIEGMLRIESGENAMFKLTALLDDEADYNDMYQSLVIRESTFEKYGIDEIIQNKIYDRRILYTYRELSNMGFIMVIEDDE